MDAAQLQLKLRHEPKASVDKIEADYLAQSKMKEKSKRPLGFEAQPGLAPGGVPPREGPNAQGQMPLLKPSEFRRNKRRCDCACGSCNPDWSKFRNRLCPSCTPGLVEGVVEFPSVTSCHTAVASRASCRGWCGRGTLQLDKATPSQAPPPSNDKRVLTSTLQPACRKQDLSNPQGVSLALRF